MTNKVTVVSGMPAGGSHATRTLEFGADDNWLYISIGSASNIDSDSSRARVVRVDISATLPIAYGGSSTKVFADGCRNEVGLRMDPFNRLWGVENGLDNLPRFMPEHDYHETNPAEKVNMFTQENAGKHYGYPYCWAEGIAENGANASFPGGLGNGTLWATQNPTPTSTMTDAWCRSETIGPVWAMQAHTAPLDIRFDTSSQIVQSPGVAAVIALHGSWNRDVASGARVDYLTLDADYNPTKLTHLVEFPTSSYTTRPVAVARTKCKSHGTCLFVTDDSGNKIFVVGRINTVPTAPFTPTSTPASVPQASAPISPNVIEVTEDLTVEWQLSDDGETLWTNVTNTNAAGWFGFAWNGNGQMTDSTAVLVLDGTFGGSGQSGASNVSQYVGYASLNQRNAASILGSWNTQAANWGYTNITASQVGNTQSLSFSRPMKCASDAPSGCYDIPTDGTPARLIFACHSSSVGNLGTQEMQFHTSRTSYSVTFPVTATPDQPTVPSLTPTSNPDEPTAAAVRVETSVLFFALIALVAALAFSF